MKRSRLSLAVVLALALASPLSAQTPGPQVHTGLPSSLIVMPAAHVAGGEIDTIRADQSGVINPPSSVSQPSGRTRLIVALAVAGACVAVGFLFGFHSIK